MSSLTKNSPLISCLSRPCAFLSPSLSLCIRHTGNFFFCFTHQGVGIIIPRQSHLLEFRFLVGFLLFFPCAGAKSFSFLFVCSSGSSSTEEEHDRVPRGDEYSNPGCSGSDQWLAAQCRGWSWQLEESRCQSLQRLLQLQHWSGALWKGTANQNRASSFYDNYLWLMYCRILTEDVTVTLNLFIKQNKLAYYSVKTLPPSLCPLPCSAQAGGAHDNQYAFVLEKWLWFVQTRLRLRKCTRNKHNSSRQHWEEVRGPTPAPPPPQSWWDHFPSQVSWLLGSHTFPASISSGNDGVE